MRVIKSIVYLVLVVVGILIAAANMQEPPVHFVYLPEIPYTSITEPQALDIPVPFLVLGAVVLGALIAGTGSILENARLRMNVGRERRRADKTAKELTGVRGELEQAVRRAEEADARAADADNKASNAERELSEVKAAAASSETPGEDSEPGPV